MKIILFPSLFKLSNAVFCNGVSLQNPNLLVKFSMDMINWTNNEFHSAGSNVEKSNYYKPTISFEMK